jgi:hypothetical protein
MLAASVPWPRPSPGELTPVDTKFTCVRSRVPNSLRPGSTPESMIATVG